MTAAKNVFLNHVDEDNLEGDWGSDDDASPLNFKSLRTADDIGSDLDISDSSSDTSSVQEVSVERNCNSNAQLSGIYRDELNKLNDDHNQKLLSLYQDFHNVLGQVQILPNKERQFLIYKSMKQIEEQITNIQSNIHSNPYQDASPLENIDIKLNKSTNPTRVTTVNDKKRRYFRSMGIIPNTGYDTITKPIPKRQLPQVTTTKPNLMINEMGWTSIKKKSPSSSNGGHVNDTHFQLSHSEKNMLKEKQQQLQSEFSRVQSKSDLECINEKRENDIDSNKNLIASSLFSSVS